MGDGASYTCITCRMVFADGESQRTHYRTAWHCFNLKRKVAGLAPVSESVFNEKVEQLQQSKELENASQPKVAKPSAFKSAQLASDSKQHKQHKIKTDKMRRIQAQVVVPNEIEEIKSNVERPEEPATEENKEPTEEELVQERLRVAKAIPVTHSLFDNHVSKDIESNLEYMRKYYGLFIPEIDYLEDLNGLVEYLGQKIGIGYACLWCQKEFRSVTAAQSHMVDKSHCKISFYEHEEEFEDFYDFTKGEEDGVEGKELVEVDDDKPLVSLSATGGELVLPNGIAIGHRALRVYYKQRTRTEDTRAEVVANKLARQYRELGMVTYTPQLRTRLREENKQHARAMDSEMRMGIKANKLPKYMRHNTSMC